MAIPIKCPGCQAAFEVPESLGGKTIRCSSCKTQLSVPAAVAAPTAKLAPVARPALAKVAAPREDDVKSKPSKSSKPSDSNPSKSSSKRRSDDDDDDDEEDERPAKKAGKKKAKSGGNGGMIALIAGGAVGLCAIIGVVVWLMMGSSDKKNTAKSDSSSSTTTPSSGAPTAPGQQAPGGSGPGMPGNGAGGPPMPGGGDGMPGMPGGGGGPGLAPPGAGGGFPMPGGPPGAGGGFPMPGGPPGTGGFPMTGAPPGTGGFPMPGGPPGAGGFPMTGAPPGAGGGFPMTGAPPGAGGFPMPGAPPGPGGFPMPGGSPGAIPGAPGGGFPMPGAIPGAPGGGFPMPGRPPGAPPGIPGGGFPGGAPGLPGGGFPGAAPGIPGGGFPGGAPGSGFPGAGGNDLDNNRPPAGAATRPQLAFKLDSFYAYAFDSEQNEFYTVGMRMDPKYPTRALGSLRRYSYPDFKMKAEFNIPNVGTRLAIDPKKGVLYLAASTNQSQNKDLWSTAFDRSHAFGDVQVFDLEPIRGGKIADGADLKPLATILTAGTIKGIELSSDNKFLYVAFNKLATGGKPKSYLRQYDTADRKLVKEIVLLEEASDMRKSADGKQLLIVEYDGTSKKEKVQIMTCDPETMVQGKSRSPGIATDIAPRPNGGMVVAIAGPSQNGVPSLKEGRLHSIDASGEAQEIPLTGWKASNNNYAKFSPDGKHLFASSFAGRDTRSGNMQNPGLDVYVLDSKSNAGFKKAASIRSAIRVNSGVQIGGYFHVTPDGENVIFHNGSVVAIDKITSNAAGADTVPEPDAGGGRAGGGFPGAGGGFPGAGGGFPGGGPGAPPGFPGGLPPLKPPG